MADSSESSQQSEGGESSNPVKGNFLERMKKAPPWVWIGLAIAAATLIIGWLALRNNSSSTNPLASASGNNPNAPGSPNSPNSPGAAPGQGQGSNSGGPYATQGEYNSLQNQIQRLQQEIQQWHNSHGRGGGHGGHHKILQSVYTVGG
jgi:hypothetical protein